MRKQPSGLFYDIIYCTSSGLIRNFLEGQDISSSLCTPSTWTGLKCIGSSPGRLTLRFSFPPKPLGVRSEMSLTADEVTELELTFPLSQSNTWCWKGNIHCQTVNVRMCDLFRPSKISYIVFYLSGTCKFQFPQLYFHNILSIFKTLMCSPKTIKNTFNMTLTIKN